MSVIEYKNNTNALSILKKYWKYESFRWPQKEVITSILEGKDTLAIMPTGGGKSICYQIPGIMKKGVCLVISPLIALMKDQVSQLNQRGCMAAAIYAGLDSFTISKILNDTIDGKYNFLYLSPERLKTSAFLSSLPYLDISLIAVDEAHCISKWGYDFRPAYLEICQIREKLAYRKFPIIALTATATKAVRADIVEKLQLSQPEIYIKSFARDNLAYTVKKAEIKELLLLDFLRKHVGAAIVYAKTRKKTVETASFLIKNGIKADFYHAGLSMPERSKKQDFWIDSSDAVMVATNAFGMGIDKADVRTVIHLDLPDNLEAYYQESGRAGRDGKPCFALLLYNDNDILTLEKNLERKYPSIETLKKTYQGLANYFQVSQGQNTALFFDFNEHDFTATFGLDILETHYSLKLLQSENLIYLSDSFFQPSRIRFLLKSHDLLAFQDRNPNIDPTIKAILRIYGGEIFSGFMTIQEKEISSALGGAYTKTIQDLKYLHKQKVIEYIEQKSTPLFSFRDFRYDAAVLPINYKELAERKSNDRRAMKAMINYASQNHNCRMLLIQDYFDEDKPKPCGKCDVCLTNHHLGLDSETSIRLKEIIWNLLPTNLVTLQQSFNNDEKEIAANIIKNALQNGEIQMDNFGLMYISK